MSKEMSKDLKKAIGWSMAGFIAASSIFSTLFVMIYATMAAFAVNGEYPGVIGTHVLMRTSSGAVTALAIYSIASLSLSVYMGNLARKKSETN